MRRTNNIVAFPARQNEREQPDERVWTEEEIRRIFHPSINRLPFVAQLDDGEGASSFNYWSVEPSDNGHADFVRGKEYAALTIDAIYADGCGSRALEFIFEALVEDAIARRAKGGRYSRTNILSVGGGFLSGLSHFICAAVAAERQRAE
jgi:hypothetical protein